VENIQSPDGFDAIRVVFPLYNGVEANGEGQPGVVRDRSGVMCHFYICMDDHNARGNANGMKVWADYLFPILDDAPEDVQFPISDG